MFNFPQTRGSDLTNFDLIFRQFVTLPSCEAVSNIYFSQQLAQYVNAARLANHAPVNNNKLTSCKTQKNLKAEAFELCEVGVFPSLFVCLTF